MSFNHECSSQALCSKVIPEENSKGNKLPAETKGTFLNNVLDLSAAISEVVSFPQADHLPKRVLEEKVAALWDTYKRTRSYREMHIRDDIVDAVIAKRTKMIMDATTIQELKRICEEPKPHYDGNQFFTTQYCIPEEELIIWSRTSLKSPLNEAGFKRYMQLFKDIFGFLPWEGN